VKEREIILSILSSVGNYHKYKLEYIELK